MEPTVTAVVLNYRTPKYAAACVAALLKQSMAERMEIMIVDNHSDDESVAMLRARFRDEPMVRVLESAANIGFGRGNLIGAERARSRYLLFVNPDNTLPPDATERMTEIMESDATIGIVGPALVHPDGSVRPSARKLPRIRDIFLKRISSHAWLRQHERGRSSHGDGPYDVGWVVGACLLIRRDLYEKLGGFDPRFFLFFEDTDLCRRAELLGYRVVYAPGVRVADRKERLSDGGMLTIFTKKTARIHLASALKYFWKWRSAP